MAQPSSTPSSKRPSTGRPSALSPWRVVGELHGAAAVELDGFDEEPVPAFMLQPELRMVSAAVAAGPDLDEELAKRGRTLSWIRTGIAAALVVAAAAVGYWSGVGGRPPVTIQAPRWNAIGVTAAGVQVNLDSVTVTVAPGEALPNGDVVQAVLPERMTYVTDHASVVVRPPSGQAAPVAAPQ